MEDVVKDDTTIVLEARVLPTMVENTIFPPRMEEPVKDEIISVLPLRVEKDRVTNPRRVDTTVVDAFVVLPLSMEMLALFTFIVETTELDTVIMLFIIVE